MCVDEQKAFLTLLDFRILPEGFCLFFRAAWLDPAGPAHWDRTRRLTVPSSSFLSLQFPVICCRKVTGIFLLLFLQTPDPHVKAIASDTDLGSF